MTALNCRPAGDTALDRHLPFDQVPAEARVRVYGVDYVRVDEPDGGELYVTRYGWPWLEHLHPERWYQDRQYVRIGEHLPVGTAAVYRVPTWGRSGRRVDLVVKFSRFATDVPLNIEMTFPDHVPAEVIDNASRASTILGLTKC